MAKQEIDDSGQKTTTSAQDPRLAHD